MNISGTPCANTDPISATLLQQYPYINCNFVILWTLKIEINDTDCKEKEAWFLDHECLLQKKNADPL